MTLALTLGGGTRTGFLSDAILQFATVPLLAISLLSLSDVSERPQLRSALLLCIAIAAVPALQLMPLPPFIWQKLPGRSAHMNIVATLGLATPWLPATVSPRATALSLASLIVPISIFIGTCQLSYAMRRVLSLVVLAIGLVSALLGFLQVAQGEASPLRLFEFTNPTEAVGFFANRNHFAALLYCVTLLAAAWTIWQARVFERAAPAKRFSPKIIIPAIAGLTLVAMLVAEQAMARSRAGLGLTMLALIGVFLISSWGRRQNGNGTLASRLLVASLALGLVFSTQFALYRVLERFERDPLEDARIPFAKNTLMAAKAYAPIGSGVGTFVPVYSQFEQPGDLLRETYANRAHNDFLEYLLEAGAAGGVLCLVAALWFMRRIREVWRSDAVSTVQEGGGSRHLRGPEEGGVLTSGRLEFDHTLARAATFVVVLLIAHSIVDYPLRTGGIAAVMAFALALLVPPPVTQVDRRARSTRHSSAEATHAGAPVRPPSPTVHAPTPPAPPQPLPQHRPLSGAAQQRTPWNSDWPEAWRSPPGKNDKTPSGGDGGAT